MRSYPTLRRLLAGEVIEIEGCLFKSKDKKLKPGDWYIGERNTGPKLLTVKSVDPRGWINSIENAYAYDVEECVPVEEVSA